ncbi:sensor histidine kinase [Spirosoma validum]|uniref:Histidine kinase n=1 Tax=Spirosoma validum TaxID=2771355 RepID=A0A927B6R0_9BACT|nr:histidine kinase [Spirosoma validum]MBD2756739.1 histidine kinase [Spirosoma validum]
MKRLNDTWLRLLGPVGLYVFVSVFFRLDLYAKLPLDSIKINAVVAITSGIICWQIARWVVLRIQQRYPGLDNIRQRLLWLLAALPILVSFAWLLRHIVRFFIEGTFYYFTTAVELSRNVGIQIFYHFIYFSLYEGWYVLQEWQRETVETSTLEKVSLQSQLTSLQHQVNPHFLFNSLNSLSSLISDSPVQADAFLNELTAVFRYLLQASDHNLVPLRDEMTFIRSYFHLLQTRYQAGLVLDVAVDPADEEGLIPPLTLQVLVENAVRYNIILPAQPLHIRIYTTPDQRLYVANTLQRKVLRVQVTGAGLTNLATRYELLNEGKLVIEEKTGWFVVSLPLVSEGRQA